MAGVIDRPLSGVSDVLGLAPGNQLRKQILVNIEIYERCVNKEKLKPTAVQLEALIGQQVVRLIDIDNSAGRFRSRVTLVFAWIVGVVLVGSTIALGHYWFNIWAIVFTFVLGFAGLMFFGVGIAARKEQDRREGIRKREGGSLDSPHLKSGLLDAVPGNGEPRTDSITS